ncbi:pyridoxal phosphate phosphatase PHOSPHO2-like isoform X2 [Stegodyphus dumicola]|uniref:pyridoxal phosphate phosphatase PHOSPHO2-like isoform X2 n=1 Tax=Stegodyphus dumicola TaxID=202533 RepID=UPI0015AF753B|nr:pyridoxal phosphate phosphatase PHOSPHO2-like isoform X2 [Stegodyphus dumicola]
MPITFCSCMEIQQILVCVDFDHTLVDCNTDLWMKALANGEGIPEDIENLSKVPNGWTTYMRELFKYLHKKNVTKEDYINRLAQLPMVDGMKDLLLEIYENGGSDIIILSDANMFFIQCFLHQQQLNSVVSKVFTNPAEFDSDGCLHIKEFQNQNSCSRCPPNLCKGLVLQNYVSQKMSEGIQFCRILYIGDGHNDVCPALKLRPSDYVFARVGYRLLRSLEKMPAKDVNAAVVPWETGHDIRNILLSS